MRKHEEISDPYSCWNAAGDDTLLFVLLGRDKAAPRAIYAWIEERVRLGLNKSDDPKIMNARDIALSMELSH